MKFSSVLAAWRSQGTFGSLQVAKDLLVGAQSSLAAEVINFATNAKGIEIGGPSRCFHRRGILPIYPVMTSLDIVNFSDQTLWEGSLVEGAPFAPEGTPLGIQFLREATALQGIPDHSYDVVFSSHCLEHTANPLRALKEWKRICKPEGYLCLVLPHRDGTFDWRRPVTPISHYLSDEQNDVGEGDETHFEEIIQLHDVRRDSGVQSVNELKRRVADNLNSRAVHHHVLDLKSAVSLVSGSGWTPTAAEARRPFDIVVLARNYAGPAADIDWASLLKASPFPSDRPRS
jgi:SAM-dependent methyltransferase